MSEHVYDLPIYPDLAMEVSRGERAVEMEERGEREERVVDIYVSTDGLDPGTQQHAVQSNTAQEQCGDSDETKKNLFRVAGLFLQLLCVLLLAVIIGLVRNTGKEKNNNQSSFDQLESRLNNLTEEQDQLETRYSNVTEEKDQLQFSFDQLQTSYNQLMEQDDTKRINCEPHEFTFFGGLCYYISTGNNNWWQSSQWCKNKQSDLMVINSKEKQDFLVSLRQRVWIGLTDREVEGNWTWVDGTHELTKSEYWRPNQPDDSGHCVEFNRVGWNDRPCGDKNKWICERVIN